MPTYRVEPAFGRWYSYHGHSHSRHDRGYAMKPTSHYCDWNIDDIARDWMSKAVNETMIDDNVIARTHEMMNIFEGGWDLSVQCYPNIELINRSHRSSTGRWWIRYDFTTLTRYHAQWCIEWNGDSDVMRDDTRVVIDDERITTNIRSTILRENSNGWFLDWLISRSMLCVSLLHDTHEIVWRAERLLCSNYTSNLRKRAHKKWLYECWSRHQLDDDLRFVCALQSAYRITLLINA